jgi:hypothetical protein
MAGLQQWQFLSICLVNSLLNCSLLWKNGHHKLRAAGGDSGGIRPRLQNIQEAQAEGRIRAHAVIYIQVLGYKHCCYGSGYAFILVGRIRIGNSDPDPGGGLNDPQK